MNKVEFLETVLEVLKYTTPLSAEYQDDVSRSIINRLNRARSNLIDAVFQVLSKAQDESSAKDIAPYDPSSDESTTRVTPTPGTTLIQGAPPCGKLPPDVLDERFIRKLIREELKKIFDAVPNMKEYELVTATIGGIPYSGTGKQNIPGASVCNELLQNIKDAISNKEDKS